MSKTNDQSGSVPSAGQHQAAQQQHPILSFMDAASELRNIRVPQDYVRPWLRQHGYSVNASGTLFKGRKHGSFEDLLPQLRLDWAVLRSALPKEVRFGDKTIEDALSVVLSEEKAKRFAEIRDKLKFSGNEDDSELRTLLFALTNKTDPVDLAVLKHFVWQAKRKLFGLPIKYEMLVSIWGAQGAGKTTVLRKLCRDNLGELYAEESLRAVLDERNYKALSRTFVNLFEELEGADRIDVDNLKKVMSAQELRWRLLGTHKSEVASQNCTFIASSNKPLGEHFSDSSGMRRFYDIETVPVIDWKSVNASVDYLKIWTSIDEAREDVYIHPVMDELRTRQESLRTQTTVEQWISELQLEPGEVRVKPKTLYAKYRDFCIAGGFRYILSQWQFSNELSRKHKFQKSGPGGRAYFLISDASAQAHFKGETIVVKAPSAEDNVLKLKVPRSE